MRRAGGGPQSRDCSLFPHSRCPWGSRGARASGRGVGWPEAPTSHYLAGVWGAPRLAGAKLCEGWAVAGASRVRPRAPQPRPGATLRRPGLRAGPRGSGRSGRRGPVRGGGGAHLPLGWPSQDFLEHPVARRAQHSGCLLFLPLPSSLHCPPAWWSWPGRPFPRPLPRPHRHLPAPSFADVELSLPSLLSVLFFSREMKKVAVNVF